MANPIAKKQLAYKHAFRREFEYFTCSQAFDKLVNILCIKQLKYEVIDEHHRKELTEFLGNSWSYKKPGNKSIYRIFEVEYTKYSQDDWIRDEINTLIPIGAGIVVKNELNKIIGFISLADCFDGFFPLHPKIISSSLPTSSLKTKAAIHCGEIYFYIKNKFIQELKQNANGYKYGVYAHPGLLTIDCKYRNCGLSLILLDFMYYISFKLGYKYTVAISTNLLTANPSNTCFCVIKKKRYDLCSHRFDDGTTMQFYFDKLERKYSLSNEQMVQFRNACQMTTIIRKYRKVNIEVIEAEIISNAQQYVKHKKTNIKSKL